MKNVIMGLGIVLVVVGLMMMAGSASDCDGKCMENANTIGEMILIAVGGLFVSAMGGVMLYMGGINED